MDKVTLTMTTCKRLPLFMRTMQTFMENCDDVELLEKVIVVDDNSSESDRQAMKRVLHHIFGEQYVDLILKTPEEAGLAQSLNYIWERTNTKYIYHLEDDWEFIRRGNFIKDGLDILKDAPHVKSVLTRKLDIFPLKTTPNGIPYYECQKGVDKIGQNRGHGYSLNPSVQDIEYLRERYGKFNLNNVENSFGDKFYEDGNRAASLMYDYVQHIGDGYSSFDINGTPR